MMRKNAKAQKGMSLIEVLISLAVLSVGLMGVMGLFPVASRHNANNWKSTQVILLAQREMDEILASNTTISTTPMLVDPVPPEIPRDAGGNPAGFVRYWGEDDPGGCSGIQIVNVEVVWTESGRTKRYLLQGAVAP